MTAEEFEAVYAEWSNMTVDQLHDLGLYPEPCDCGEDMCQGWAMDLAGRHSLRFHGAIVEAAWRYE